MPQARLPDVNTAFNTHRKRAIMAIEAGNWTEAIGALYSINAALPLEYRVIISDQKYEDLIKEDKTVRCAGCEGVIDYNTISIITVFQSPMAQLLTHRNTERVWFCPRCHHKNYQSQTTVEHTILAQPYYLGVIKKPPPRTDMLDAHLKYDRELERWCWTMLSELEQKMAQFRDDNWERTDGNEENQNGPVDTSWEESDDNG